jgi:hypothetical protein
MPGQFQGTAHVENATKREANVEYLDVTPIVPPYDYICNPATLVDYGGCFDHLSDPALSLLLGAGR